MHAIKARIAPRTWLSYILFSEVFFSRQRQITPRKASRVKAMSHKVMVSLSKIAAKIMTNRGLLFIIRVIFPDGANFRAVKNSK